MQRKSTQHCYQANVINAALFLQIRTAHSVLSIHAYLMQSFPVPVRKKMLQKWMLEVVELGPVRG